MRWRFVSWHAAAPDGTAAGRQLHAVGEALRAAGHDVQAWSWRPTPPTGDVADWCEWRPLTPEAVWRTRSRALVRPRADIVRMHWRAPDDAIVVADDPASWGAVSGNGTSRIATIHYSVGLDRRALRDRSPARLQDWRGERRAVRAAMQSWALSDRVAQQTRCDVVVPATIPMPADRLPLVEEPVVGMLADWDWPPNVDAARRLLGMWPTVRAQVPHARLLLAGRGGPPTTAADGVEFLGVVPHADDLLSRLAVFAFPCPPTSGPKMKVLDAMAHGVPVVTTDYGVEGITGGRQAAVVCDDADMATALVALLRDPNRRAELSADAQRAVKSGHAPDVAARARIDAVRAMSSRAMAREG